VEDVSTTGGTTTTTAYYYMAGKRIGLSVNGTISYLASDGLGSATVTLSSGGSATAAQLFAPYGGVRYSSGSMPMTYGFTGQRSDVASGLDYYGARYYDPVAAQFTSGDSVLPAGGFDLWGLSRYAYVSDNPIIRVDPTGHDDLTPGEGGGCDPSDPSCGGGTVDTPPADPCGGSCSYDYGGDNGGTSYNPPPPDPVPNPIVGPACGCAGASQAVAPMARATTTQFPSQSWGQQLGISYGADVNVTGFAGASAGVGSTDAWGEAYFSEDNYQSVNTYHAYGDLIPGGTSDYQPWGNDTADAGNPFPGQRGALGAAAGAGPEVWISNAKDREEFVGVFSETVVSLGPVSITWATAPSPHDPYKQVWVFGVGTSLGGGVGFTQFDTNTRYGGWW
jgi:RHS repeat-associated protein